METFSYDVVVLGAGGAGMMCAATAARRGRKTLALDHADKLGKKILISGGGRCNFTNLYASWKTYFSQNEHFAKSALARYTPEDFLRLVDKYKIPYHEKKLGQQFCDDTAQRIVDLLYSECKEAGAEIRLGCKIEEVKKKEKGFEVYTNQGLFLCESVVIATGGPSIPKIGATDFGQRLAKKFGHTITELAPALVSLTMPQDFQNRFRELSGVSCDTVVKVNGQEFRENILFTHNGLSGPAILQASLYWFPGDSLFINLVPEKDLCQWLLEKKKQSKMETKNILSEIFTKRFAEILTEEFLGLEGPINQIPDAKLRTFAETLQNWELKPTDTGGYGKAEVTRGGVLTDELSSKTMESKIVPGLYCIGEVVDVTGRLGGYNFQWAWASGHAAGSAC